MHAWLAKLNSVTGVHVHACDTFYPLHAVIECDEELSAPLDAFITFSSVFTLPPFSYQANATYSCEVGFRLSSGNRVRTCIGSTEGPGKWSGTAPTCEGIVCM